jgi:hypothetical protein
MALPVQSLNFVASSNQQLAITDGDFGAFDRAKFAIFGTIRRSSTTGSGSHTIMCQQALAGGDVSFILRFNNDRLDFLVSTDGTTVHGRLLTTATFTSTTSPVSFMVHYDSANATAGDRMRMWTANGFAALVEQTSFTTDTNPTTSIRNSTAAVRVGGDGPSAADFDGDVWRLSFVSGSLPAVTDIETSGTPIDASGITGLWSLLDVAGGVVTHDAVLATAWTNTNAVTATNWKPFVFASLASTESDDTLSASLKVRATTSLASTEENDTMAANANVFTGRTTTLASTEENDTLSSASKVAINSSFAVTENNDTLSAVALAKITSSLSSTESDDTLSAALKVRATTSLASTEENDALSSSSKLKITVNSAITESNDTLSSSADAIITTSLAITEIDDTMAANATVAYAAIDATLASTEANDTLSSSSKVKINNIFAVTESNDTLAADSKIAISSSFSVTEENDTMLGYLIPGANMSGAMVEQNDTLSSLSKILLQSSFASTENDDSLNSYTLTGGYDTSFYMGFNLFNFIL